MHLELVTEALRMEIKGFGNNFTNLAPGDFATNIASGRYHSPKFYWRIHTTKQPYGNTLEMHERMLDEAGQILCGGSYGFKL